MILIDKQRIIEHDGISTHLFQEDSRKCLLRERYEAIRIVGKYVLEVYYSRKGTDGSYLEMDLKIPTIIKFNEDFTKTDFFLEIQKFLKKRKEKQFSLD